MRSLYLDINTHYLFSYQHADITYLRIAEGTTWVDGEMHHLRYNVLTAECSIKPPGHDVRVSDILAPAGRSEGVGGGTDRNRQALQQQQQ